MDFGPIPWSSIDRYATRHGIVDLDDFDVLENHIRSLENAALEVEQRMKKRAKDV